MYAKNILKIYIDLTTRTKIVC